MNKCYGNIACLTEDDGYHSMYTVSLPSSKESEEANFPPKMSEKQRRLLACFRTDKIQYSNPRKGQLLWGYYYEASSFVFYAELNTKRSL